ncbi:MAG: acyl-CoA dehydrogenase family protein [Acidimicrobiales bacterium]
MQFSFSDDQLALRDQMRAFAQKECPPSEVRDAWSSELGWSEERWSALAEMGVVGLTVPEVQGGLGLGQVELVLLLEEAGRACMPEPLIETIAVGGPLLSDCDGARAEELRDGWLADVARGEAIVAVGLARAPGVAAAHGAQLIVLEHGTGDGSELHVVEASQVEVRTRHSLDGTRRLSVIEWEPSRSSLVASGAQSESLVATSLDRASTAAAAMLLGVAEHMISMASQYALERTQFGKPIGSYQAVKHLLANALVRVEFARPLVYRAAWSLDAHDEGASLHASMAKAQASEAALTAARVALQVHGAIGYTWEHDLQLWMKRAWALASAWGDAGHHRARVLEALAPDGTGA